MIKYELGHVEWEGDKLFLSGKQGILEKLKPSELIFS